MAMGTMTTRRWCRWLAGAWCATALWSTAYAAAEDSIGPLAELEVLLDRQWLVPPKEVAFESDVRTRFEEIADRRHPAARAWIQQQYEWQHLQPGISGGLAGARALVSWVNRQVLATLALPPIEKEQVVRLQIGDEATGCTAWPLAHPNWPELEQRFARMTPAQRTTWLGLYERLHGEATGRVQPAARPAFEMAASLGGFIARGDQATASPAWKAPESARTWLMNEEEFATERDCRTRRWWLQQVLALPSDKRTPLLDAYLWFEADTMLQGTCLLCSDDPGEGRPYPEDARLLEIQGKTVVVVSLDKERRPVDARVVERKLDFSWLRGDVPAIVERLFDGESVDMAMKRTYDEASLSHSERTHGRKGEVRLEFLWNLN